MYVQVLDQTKKMSWLGKKNSEFSIWATHKSDSHDTNLMTDLPAQLTWCKYGLFIYMLKLKYACAKVQTWANSLEIHPMGIRLNPGPTNCQELPISTASHMTLDCKPRPGSSNGRQGHLEGDCTINDLSCGQTMMIIKY